MPIFNPLTSLLDRANATIDYWAPPGGRIHVVLDSWKEYQLGPYKVGLGSSLAAINCYINPVHAKIPLFPYNIASHPDLEIQVFQGRQFQVIEAGDEPASSVGSSFFWKKG